jgi:polyhydroxybutyrate depolymerase
VQNRDVLIHVPFNPPKTGTLPVVILNHGGGGFPALMAWQSKMNAVADKEGFIVAYPQGTPILPFVQMWYFNATPKPKTSNIANVDEQTFFDEVIDTLIKNWRVDKDRVYMAGLSNGGHMSHRYGSASKKVAAIGMVASVRNPGYWQILDRDLPVCIIHGLNDNYFPIEGGTTQFDAAFEPFVFPNLLEAAYEWYTFNKCDKLKVTSINTGAFKYTGYKNGKELVVLYGINNHGHAWPQGRITPAELNAVPTCGPLSDAVNGSQVLWDFFKQFGGIK